MPIEVPDTLYIVVRKLSPTEMQPMIIYGKKTGKVGLAAFSDYNHARSMGDGWEPDADVSEMDKASFARVLGFYLKPLRITHVALDAGNEKNGKNAIWIPVGEFGV